MGVKSIQESVSWIFCGSIYLMAGFLWIAHNIRSHFAQHTSDKLERAGMESWWTVAVAIGVILWPIGLAISVLVMAVQSVQRERES